VAMETRRSSDVRVCRGVWLQVLVPCGRKTCRAIPISEAVQHIVSNLPRPYVVGVEGCRQRKVFAPARARTRECGFYQKAIFKRRVLLVNIYPSSAYNQHVCFKNSLTMFCAFINTYFITLKGHFKFFKCGAFLVTSLIHNPSILYPACGHFFPHFSISCPFCPYE